MVEQFRETIPKDKLLEEDLFYGSGVFYTTNAFLPFPCKGTIKKVISISSGLADSRSSG
ncbi:hypothetical protein OH77DRAFT_1525337 [Trametes cingulata]|nr:hypothetical protein OH77DRAFT_1525337 [Trametes cingulata]